MHLLHLSFAGQSEDGDCYAHLRRLGKFHETKRTDGISTSDIIMRVMLRYEEYVERQLKRGYTAEQLKIPAWKAEQLVSKEVVPQAF